MFLSNRTKLIPRLWYVNCNFISKKIMKQILIAATAVGVAIAGIILYGQKRNTGSKPIADAAKDAYNTMNKGLGKIKRNTVHTMG